MRVHSGFGTALFALLLSLFLILPKSTTAAGTLTLTFTNTVLQESAGTLSHWGRISLSPCPTQNVDALLIVSDTSELLVTNLVALSTNDCEAYFDLTAVWDAHVDGRQTVALFASAPGYEATSNTIDVLHTGGPERALQFRTDAYLNIFEEVQSTSLTGPATINFSSCLYHPSQDRIYILINSTPGPGVPSIQVYQADGTYERRVLLQGFQDAEGFCLVSAESNLFAIVEEGTFDRLTLINIQTNSTSVNRASATSYAITLPAPKVFNKGLEGVVYDRENDCFYLVQERDPMGVYRVTLEESVATLDILLDAERVFDGRATDLSDITFDPFTGNLLILSDESSTLFECSLDGQIHSMIDIDAVQPEGVTLMPDGRTLFITGEPNEFRRLEMKAPLTRTSEGSNVIVNLALSYPFDQAIDVSLISTDLTATAGLDYMLPTGLITFAAGQTTTSGQISILNDLDAQESTERFAISLSSTDTNLVYGPLRLQDIDIQGQALSLWVLSQYGNTSPPPGLQTAYKGDLFNLRVLDSPVNAGAFTQYVCTGWTGTGSIPPTGSGVQTGDIVITNESSITWLWSTNYWLGVSATEGATVHGGNQWYTIGSTGNLQAVDSGYFEFQNWAGDLPPGLVSNASISLQMDFPRQVFATFIIPATSNGVPIGWMTQFFNETNDLELLSRLDVDEDGMPTWAEYIADTSPIATSSVLRFSNLFAHPTGPWMVVQWPGSKERIYDLDRYMDLANTTTVVRIANGIPGAESGLNQRLDVTFPGATYKLHVRIP